MSSVAHEARLPDVRPPLPGWGAAFTAAFLGWCLTFFSVLAVGLVAELFGLLGHLQGGGLRDWPYPDSGWASLTANAVAWVWILALTALVVRGLLADRSPRPISAVPVFVILAATGFAPGLPRGLVELPWPIALVVSAALLRFTPAFSPPTLTKRRTTALLAGGALFLIVPAAHGFLHPVWPGSFSVGESIGSPPPRGNTTTFSVRNEGFQPVELDQILLRSTLPFVALELKDVRVDRQPPFERASPFGQSPGLPYTLEGRSEAFIQLSLKDVPCGSSSLPSKAIISYSAHGAGRATAVPVAINLRPCS
jgi:hypothetical protein